MSSGINPLHCEYVKHQKKMNQIYEKSKYTYQGRKHDITLIPLWRIFWNTLLIRRDTLNTIYSQSNSISICEKLICFRNISSCLFPHISTITSPNHYLSEWDDWEKQGLPEEQRTEAVRRLRACLTSKGHKLDLRALALSSLPVLPACIKKLDVSCNKLTILTDLPENIKELIARDNFLTHISALPHYLITLDVSENQLENLPLLPDTIKSLSAEYNRLSTLPSLPLNLKNLRLGTTNCKLFHLCLLILRYLRLRTTILLNCPLYLGDCNFFLHIAID